MLAPASKMNDAAICVMAKARSRFVVLPVMRGPPLARPIPCDVFASGRRGTNANTKAAISASPALTQSMLESTVKSSARSENFEA